MVSIPNSNDTIFEVAEISPSFPGGETTMFEFLAKNLLYPESMIDACIGGKVICSFVVEIDGSITNIKVVRGVHELLDNEAVRVIKLMPKWIREEWKESRLDHCVICQLYLNGMICERLCQSLYFHCSHLEIGKFSCNFAVLKTEKDENSNHGRRKMGTFLTDVLCIQHEVVLYDTDPKNYALSSYA